MVMASATTFVSFLLNFFITPLYCMYNPYLYSPSTTTSYWYIEESIYILVNCESPLEGGQLLKEAKYTVTIKIECLCDDSGRYFKLTLY